MKRAAVFLGPLLCCLLAGGCGGRGPEWDVAKEVNEANEQLTEVARKANQIDLDAYREAQRRFEERKANALAKLDGLSPERRKEAMATIGKLTIQSRDRMNEATAYAPWHLKSGPNPVVVMETSLGTLRIALFRRAAPVTVKNFLRYVDEKFYDGTLFHRVVTHSLIQGGGYEPGLKEKKTHAPIPSESYNELGNDRGTVAMARTPEPDSATTQFFINVTDNPGLDRARSDDGYGYTVFGRVLDGADVVDKIRGAKTHSVGGHENVPVEDIIIKSVRREDPK